MKEVLIIATLYGSKRVVGLATNLPEFGWKPTVITPKISWQPTIISPMPRILPKLPFTVVETGYKDTGGFLRRTLRIDTVGEPRAWVEGLIKCRPWKYLVDNMLRLGGMVVNYPDSFNGWARYALEVGETILDNNHFDAVISICPVTSHIVASRLKDKYGLLWLADFPDLWSQNVGYTYGRIRKWFDRRLEVKTLRKVDILACASQDWVDRLRSIHNAKPTYPIMLGFNAEDYDSTLVGITTKFTITYTGMISTGEHHPSRLLEALAGLLTSNQLDKDDIEVNFYGMKVGWFEEEINSYGLSDIVYQHGLVSHEVAVQKQRESWVLLLLDCDFPNEMGSYTGKIFEYLGAHRPILAVGGVHGNAVGKLLDETCSGIHAPTVEEIKVALVNWYSEYKTRGGIVYRGIEAKIQKYSNREMARKFASVLSGGAGK